MSEHSFLIKVESFDALVDLEIAVEVALDTLADYGYLSDTEAESRENLAALLRQIVSMRYPITEQRKRR